MGSDDLREIGAAKEIIDIVKKRERKYSIIFSKWRQPALLLLYAVALVIFYKQDLPLSIFWLIIFFYAFIEMICFIFFDLKNDLNHFSIVEFINKRNALNFFQRNKDQIIVGIIISILSIIGTLVFKKLF